MRFAICHSDPRAVAAYLPAGYSLVDMGYDDDGKQVTLIYGHDDAGWTLDDYVIPRLASGLHVAVELVRADAPRRSEHP